MSEQRIYVYNHRQKKITIHSACSYIPSSFIFRSSIGVIIGAVIGGLVGLVLFVVLVVVLCVCVCKKSSGSRGTVIHPASQSIAVVNSELLILNNVKLIKAVPLW